MSISRYLLKNSNLRPQKERKEKTSIFSEQFLLCERTVRTNGQMEKLINFKYYRWSNDKMFKIYIDGYIGSS
jgi:hypothetical protein